MAKIQVIVSPYLVSEDELSDAAKEAADAVLESVEGLPTCPQMSGSPRLPPRVDARDCVTPDYVRQVMDLPTWVGIPTELLHAIRVEILERTARPAPTRRLGDYCPS